MAEQEKPEQLELIETAETAENIEEEAKDAKEEESQKEDVQEKVSEEPEAAKEPEAKAEEPEPEPEPEPEKKQDDKSAGLRNLLKTERAEVSRLQDVIQGLLDTLTKDLSAEDKELLTSLGGDKADAKLNIFNRLKSAGKIGAAATKKPEVIPEADRTRVAAGDGAKAKPKGWKDADRRMSRRLKQVR